MASGVAAAGAAVAFYFYSRRVRLCGFGGGGPEPAAAFGTSHFEGAYQAPSTWVEAMYFFAEALRYMYNESLGRWRTADLLIGLAYLARQESANRAVADIAGTGCLVGDGADSEARQKRVEEFKRIAHFMKYCQALRERRIPAQTLLLARLGIAQEDIVLQQGFAGMLKPSYVLVLDHRMRSVVLAIRGTHSVKDMFTSLTSASKPHHMLSGSGVVLGYSHFGMLAAARWVLQQTQEALHKAVASSPGYHLQVVGHSLGAGTAALLTTRLREIGGVFANATCLAIACPACMTMELARSCASYVTTIINGHDMIPTLSPGAADALREEVMQSSWYEAFRADMRSSVVVRAVEASLGGVGSVTSAASTWTASSLSAASRSLRACYQRRGAPALKRSGSDADQLAVLPSARPELSANAGSVQFAREWASPEDDHASPSWDQILQMLEPLEAEAQAREEASGQLQADEPVRASWPSTSWEGRWERSEAEALEPGPAKSVYQRAGNLWSVLWLRGCQVDRRKASFETMRDAASMATADTNFDSLKHPVPSVDMRMARNESDAAHLAEDGLSPRVSFRQELLAAEMDLQDPELPVTPPHARCNAEPFPAGATDLSSPASPSPERGQVSEEERQWRRMTYPAGRIYHLVPARLVFDSDASSGGRTQTSESRDSDSREHQQSDVHTALQEGVVGFESLANGEEYVVVRSQGATSSEVSGLAPPIPPSEDFVLLEDVPQEVYARIRLCSRMLADHFIPAYLGSLETALRYIEKGYPQRQTD